MILIFLSRSSSPVRVRDNRMAVYSTDLSVFFSLPEVSLCLSMDLHKERKGEEPEYLRFLLRKLRGSFERRGGPSPSSAYRISVGQLSVDRSKEVGAPASITFATYKPIIFSVDQSTSGHSSQSDSDLRTQLFDCSSTSHHTCYLASAPT